MSELTPWFKPSVKPAREGVYEVFWYCSPVYAMWDGKNWRTGADRSKEDAEKQFTIAKEAPKWRGLSSDPSGKGE